MYSQIMARESPITRYGNVIDIQCQYHYTPQKTSSFITTQIHHDNTILNTDPTAGHSSYWRISYLYWWILQIRLDNGQFLPLVSLTFAWSLSDTVPCFKTELHLVRIYHVKITQLMGFPLMDVKQCVHIDCKY